MCYNTGHRGQCYIHFRGVTYGRSKVSYHQTSTLHFYMHALDISDYLSRGVIYGRSFYTSCLGVGKTLFSLMFFINKLECLSLSTIFSLSLLFSSLHIDTFKRMPLIRMVRNRIECQFLFLGVLLHFCTFPLSVCRSAECRISHLGRLIINVRLG